MLSKLKINVSVVLIAFSLVTISVIAPYTNMFGKHYKSSQDFTCCKGDQLFVHHYYSTNLFWVEIDNGYKVEPVGKPTPGGCNIQCGE
jgi:hypothetical protein